MSSPEIIKTVEGMRKYSSAAQVSGKTVGLVPTMGAIHKGHLSLIKAARAQTDICVVSIFVNPLQFSAGEDFAGYKRDEKGDIEKISRSLADAVFLPSRDEIYPSGFQTSVEVETLQRFLCGASRPGHFKGVATVVLKLFNIVRPAAAAFGEKDYQQLLIIKRMAADLNLDVKIISVPTVRDERGLALSSRNQYLSEREMERAVEIPRVLFTMKRLFDSGVRARSELRRAAETASEKGLEFEYLEICDSRTLVSVETASEGSMAAVAARVGKARLIDSIKF